MTSQLGYIMWSVTRAVTPIWSTEKTKFLKKEIQIKHPYSCLLEEVNFSYQDDGKSNSWKNRSIRTFIMVMWRGQLPVNGQLYIIPLMSKSLRKYIFSIKVGPRQEHLMPQTWQKDIQFPQIQYLLWKILHSIKHRDKTQPHLRSYAT